MNAPRFVGGPYDSSEVGDVLAPGSNTPESIALPVPDEWPEESLGKDSVTYTEYVYQKRIRRGGGWDYVLKSSVHAKRTE